MHNINTFFRRNDSITLEQIRNFIAIYELGSLSLAAEQAYKTQPALSFSISKLEKSLNTVLIKRNRGKNISFTEEGHRFYQKISPLFQQLLTQIDELESKHTISIGFTDDFPMDKQLRLHEKITTETDARIRFLCDFSCRIQAMVKTGQLAFAIVKQLSEDGRKQPQWAAANNNHAIISQASHQAAPQETAPKIAQATVFDSLHKLPIVSGHSGCFVRDLTENTLNQVGKDFYFSYLTNHVQNQIEAVQSGFGIGVFEHQRIQDTPDLIELDEQYGFPRLARFDYTLVGEPNTALHNKIYPILNECVASLNDDTEL